MTKVKSKPQSRTTKKTTTRLKNLPTSKRTKLTKKSQLIRLLSKEAGADISSISKKFGWLPHTTRATLSRLRNSGYEISSKKAGAGKPTKYRITSAPAESLAQ